MAALHKDGVRQFDLSVGNYAFKRRFGAVQFPLTDASVALGWRRRSLSSCATAPHSGCGVIPGWPKGWGARWVSSSRRMENNRCRTPDRAKPRCTFRVLDSWRGIAALLVALFHLDIYSALYSLDFTRNAFLFVDFFFVLSGFVITHSYAAPSRDAGRGGDICDQASWPPVAAACRGAAGIHYRRKRQGISGVARFIVLHSAVYRTQLTQYDCVESCLRAVARLHTAPDLESPELEYFRGILGLYDLCRGAFCCHSMVFAHPFCGCYCCFGADSRQRGDPHFVRKTRYRRDL